MKKWIFGVKLATVKKWNGKGRFALPTERALRFKKEEASGAKWPLAKGRKRSEIFETDV